MRIAYFAESLPPLVDGVSRTLSHLIESLQDEGIEFRLYTGMEDARGQVWGDHVRTLPAIKSLLYGDYRIAIPQGRLLKPDMEAFAPDLIHVTSPSPLSIWAMEHARQAGIPSVASFHTDFASYLRYHGAGMLEGVCWSILKWIYNRADAVFTPSESFLRELESRGIQNVRLWPHGIDEARFSLRYRSDEFRSLLPGEGPILLYVGRLVREKGLDDLAEAARLLTDRGVAFRLAIVGEGPMKVELRRRLPSAFFTGCLEGLDLSRWYASADVFAFPSSTETFGNVVLEAFSSGLPVVGVARGGVCDLVEPGRNGFLAPVDDPQAYARLLERLILDDPLRWQLGGAARVTAARYRWPEVNRRLFEGYRALLENVPARRFRTSA